MLNEELGSKWHPARRVVHSMTRLMHVKMSDVSRVAAAVRVGAGAGCIAAHTITDRMPGWLLRWICCAHTAPMQRPSPAAECVRAHKCKDTGLSHWPPPVAPMDMGMQVECTGLHDGGMHGHARSAWAFSMNAAKGRTCNEPWGGYL